MVHSGGRAAGLGRYWRTARHLRPAQVCDRLTRRLPRWPAPEWDAARHRPAAGPWTGAGSRPAVFLPDGRVRLLHREAPLGDWNPAAMPRLWRYHLHYFDDIASPCFAPAAARWMDENPASAGPGWEPYPLSRRIPNWIQWLLRGHTPVAGMLASLDAQARVLSARLEYHLLGNHLLANLRALVFAGCFLANRPSFLARAGEFSRELDSQLLAGGGHEERSPMYHALILTDLLELIELGAIYPGVIPSHHLEDWRRNAGRMLAWLQRLCHPDGAIAFFQDAAFDMAPPPAQILGYARRLGVEPAGEGGDASGYARLENQHTAVLADVGGPGPAHQPGHAHAGALSYEVSHLGERMIVNSGTSTYEPGPERAYERSTSAHNTLRLDGRDQSEMWAAFRVGRRASVQEHERRDGEISASHDGFAPVVHARRIQLERGALLVTDQLHGSGRHDVEIFHHFHPDVALSGQGGVFEARHARGPLLRLSVPGRMEASLEASEWRPEFGLRRPNARLVFRGRLELPATLETRLECGV